MFWFGKDNYRYRRRLWTLSAVILPKRFEFRYPTLIRTSVCQTTATATERYPLRRERRWGPPWRSHAAFVFRRLRKPSALNGSLVGHGVVVRLGLRWFGGRISRSAQERTRLVYDYRLVPVNERDVNIRIYHEAAAKLVSYRQTGGPRRVGTAHGQYRTAAARPCCRPEPRCRERIENDTKKFRKWEKTQILRVVVDQGPSKSRRIKNVDGYLGYLLFFSRALLMLRGTARKTGASLA